MPLTAIFTMRVPTFKSTRLPFKFWLGIVGSVASSPTKIGPLTQGFQVSSGPHEPGPTCCQAAQNEIGPLGKFLGRNFFFQGMG